MRTDRSPSTQPLPMTMGCHRQEHTLHVSRRGQLGVYRWCSTTLSPLWYTIHSPCLGKRVPLTSKTKLTASRLCAIKAAPGATTVPSPTDSMSGSVQTSPSQHTFLPTRIPESLRTAL
eukprot:scaffold115961_cov72-Phaeocystis_antarctica.AAC.4